MATYYSIDNKELYIENIPQKKLGKTISTLNSLGYFVFTVVEEKKGNLHFYIHSNYANNNPESATKWSLIGPRLQASPLGFMCL